MNALKHWVNPKSLNKQLGIDAEFAFNFMPGVDPDIELIQISCPNHRYVISIKQVGDQQSLCKLLALISDPNVLKLGIGLKADLKGLGRHLKLTSVAN